MRVIALLVGMSLALGGCASASEPVAAPAPTSTKAACVAPTSADLATSDGWLGYMAAHPDAVSLVIDNGHGTVVRHRADSAQPLASAVKIVYLAAYAKAVSAQKVNPDEQVSLLEWERWYVPGTDGSAHVTALTRLGVANDGIRATDLAKTVRLNDMVTAMIQESDNSGADFLRFRLGDQALVDAAAAGGWTDFVPMSLTGGSLGFYDAGITPETSWATAQKYAFDEKFRAETVAGATKFPSYEQQTDVVSRLWSQAGAEQLNSLIRSVVDGSFGSGGDVFLRQYEWQTPSPDQQKVGFKGGSLPGTLTQTFEVQHSDGTRATAVWLTDGLSPTDYKTALNPAAQQKLMLDAMTDDTVLAQIACVA